MDGCIDLGQTQGNQQRKYAKIYECLSEDIDRKVLSDCFGLHGSNQKLPIFFVDDLQAPSESAGVEEPGRHFLVILMYFITIESFEYILD